MALASSGASTLVGLMVSDGWAQVRGRVARLLARDGDTASAEGELERSRDEVVAARAAGDADAGADFEDEWGLRFRRFLRSDPEAARQLFAVLNEMSGGGAAPGSVSNAISGGEQHAPVLQGRDFSGLTFNAPPATDPEGRSSR